jgi:hypothetical protein
LEISHFPLTFWNHAGSWNLDASEKNHNICFRAVCSDQCKKQNATFRNVLFSEYTRKRMETEAHVSFLQSAAMLSIVLVGDGLQKVTRMEACLLSQPLQSNFCGF